MLIEKKGLVPAIILRRYKRFLADVELEGGGTAIAHCTNTGTMASSWAPGDRVLLEASRNPDRKLPYTWIACLREGAWVGVETGMPNKVVAEAARQDRLPGLPGLHTVLTERKYGLEGSRIDVLALDGQGRQVYIEVKNTTLRVGEHACFPDAVSVRGAKHLRELRAAVALGHRGAIVFFVHRGDVAAFDAAREIDPAYAAELDRARDGGVEILPLKVALEAREGDGGLWDLSWDLPGLLPWVRRGKGLP